MGVFGACFGCCSTVPEVTPRPGPTKATAQAGQGDKDLTRDELKQLYEHCIGVNGGRLIVHGIFARANTKNNNRRIYPKNILRREVTKFEESHIWAGTALGELDHPNYASRYFKCLNLANISHQVLEVHWDGDQLLGTIEVLPTPSGQLLWELYRQGIKLGVSSRGWASLRSDPRTRSVYVDDDFELITFDFVTEPSTHGAFLVPICYQYSGCLPDQRKAVQVAHLGHGVVSMRNIPHVPEVPILVHRINQLQAQQAQQMVHGLQAPAPMLQPASVPAHVLDQLLLYSHYLVLPGAAYLDREPHARDYHSHLAMFVTRAHLADQAQRMTRADLNAIILREVTRDAHARQAAVPGAMVQAGAPTSYGASSCHTEPYQTQQQPHQQQQEAQRAIQLVGNPSAPAAVACGRVHHQVLPLDAADTTGQACSMGNTVRKGAPGQVEVAASTFSAGWDVGTQPRKSPSAGSHTLPSSNSGACSDQSKRASPPPPPPQQQQRSTRGASSSHSCSDALASGCGEQQHPSHHMPTQQAGVGLDQDAIAAWSLHPHACNCPDGGPQQQGEYASGYQEGRHCHSSGSSHSQGSSSSRTGSLDATAALLCSDPPTTGGGGAAPEPGGTMCLLNTSNSSTCCHTRGGSSQCLRCSSSSYSSGAASSSEQAHDGVGMRGEGQGQAEPGPASSRLAPWEASLMAAQLLQAADAGVRGSGQARTGGCGSLAATPPVVPLNKVLLDRARGSSRLGSPGSRSLEDEPVVAVMPQGVVQLLPSKLAPPAAAAVAPPLPPPTAASAAAATQAGSTRTTPVQAWSAADSRGTADVPAQLLRACVPAAAVQAGTGDVSHSCGHTQQQVVVPQQQQVPSTQNGFDVLLDGELAAEFERIRGTLSSLAAKLCAQRQAVQAAYQLQVLTDPELLGPKRLHLGAAMPTAPA